MKAATQNLYGNKFNFLLSYTDINSQHFTQWDNNIINDY